ncbi:sterol desaturase family protein [Pedobacter sp. PWIIR3]
MNTSIHHNLHHSKFKGNYGLYFRFWDRLMGTENPNYVKEYDRIQNQRFL